MRPGHRAFPHPQMPVLADTKVMPESDETAEPWPRAPVTPDLKRGQSFFSCLAASMILAARWEGTSS